MKRIFLSGKRRFSARQRIALYMAARGKCQICNRRLGRGWHADHHYPFSKGGLTVIQNGRATCWKCNLKKSNAVPEDFL